MKINHIHTRLYTMCSLLLGGALLFTTTSCDDYLSKNPNEGPDEVLQSCNQVDALLGNSSLLQSHAILSLTSTSDYGLTTALADQLYMLDPQTVNGLVWDIDGQRKLTNGDEAWNAEYAKIFTANLLLNEMDEIVDLTDEKRVEYEAQARFIRATAMWQLVTLYCKPYAEENLGSLGLPLKQTTSYEESMQRATLKQTYDFIEADLLEALGTARADIEERWLVSTPAVHAWLARFYLFTMDYAKAASHAAEALKSSVAQLQDFNTLTQYEDVVYSYDDMGNMVELPVSYSELYGYSPSQYTQYVEFYFAQVYRCFGSTYLIPSQELMAIYDMESDLRYRHLFVENALLNDNLNDYGQNISYKYFTTTYGEQILPAGPTVAEMLLTRAEALARQGEYQDGMVVLNQLRASRFDVSADAGLSASTQAEALALILDERHREMPFVGYWQDVRRLAYNETTADDITLHRSFYQVSNNAVDNQEVKDYTLPVKSSRYAQPILDLEIARSGNQLQQNEY